MGESTKRDCESDLIIEGAKFQCTYREGHWKDGSPQHYYEDSVIIIKWRYKAEGE